MKTQVLFTPLGRIIKLGDETSDGDRAWRRAEKKHGCEFVGFYNGTGAESGSEANKRHWRRAAANREEMWVHGPEHVRERRYSRVAQSLAAKALKAKLAAAGHDVKGMSANDAFKRYEHELPGGAGKLNKIANHGLPCVVPLRPLPLP